MIKQIPILFTTDMVKSILAGLKSLTRRLSGLKKINQHPDKYKFIGMREVSRQNVYCAEFEVEGSSSIIRVRSVYGRPGDILWVRETWLYVMLDHAHDLLEGAGSNSQYVFKNQFHSDWFEYAREKYGYKWKPNIHMPKSACRIWLEVVSIRVERLNDITEQDAIAEGVERHVPVPGDGPVLYKSYQLVNANPFTQAVSSFRTLIESINGTEIWNKNPWVWVVCFKIISTTGKPSDI